MNEFMRLYDECRFFATEKEARKFMKELDKKKIGYYWGHYEGMPDITIFEDSADFLAWIEEEDRYILAALNYGLAEEQMEEFPHCVLMYSKEFNAIHQRNLKMIEERLKAEEK